MAGWSVYHIFIFFYCIEIRNWNGLIMSDHKSYLWARGWAPAFNSCVHTGLHQIYGTFTPLFVLLSIRRLPFLVSSPSSLWRLMKTFGDKPINRPRIPKLINWSNFIRPLCISFCNLNSLYSQIHHQFCPFFIALRFFLKLPSIMSNIKQSFFDKPTDHSRISTTTWNWCSRKVLFSNIF